MLEPDEQKELLERLRDRGNRLELSLCELAADEIEHLQKLLDGRDKFIVNQGLFEAFVATLPPPPAPQR